MDFDEEMLEKVIETLEGEVHSVKEISETVDVNPMFLSGFLHALHEVGVLDKKVVGGTHIYQIKNKDLLEDLMS